jgi:hypothetical protein
MEISKKKELIIKAGFKAVDHLIKVAEENIITNSEEDLTADKLKNAAQAKNIAIMDAFDILDKINEEQAILDNEKGDGTERQLTGFTKRNAK